MDLENWKPFKDFSNLREEVNKVFDRVFKEKPEGFQDLSNIPLDLSETSDSAIVRIEVPGVEPGDFELSMTGDVLTIRGEKKRGREEAPETYHQTERNYGTFSRSVRIPVSVQVDKIKASYKNGVLQVTLPKTQEAKTQTIKINVEP
jgi:HSP20 family protein